MTQIFGNWLKHAMNGCCPLVDSEKTVEETGDIVKHLGSSSSASPKAFMFVHLLARLFTCSFVHSIIVWRM